jgi:exonuclease SbcC
MLKRLKYSVTFASTGKTLANDLSFEPGLTAISGPNESGKSTILEMIRFALFGTEALRGKLSSLKDYDLELTFSLRGQEWTVRRSPGKASLACNDKAVVTGVSPVDGRIVQLFGYGLKVFDIANNCNQGDVEALTRMKGGERKRLVDQTIGFDVIDNVQKFVSDEAAEVRGEVKAIQVIEPVAPTGSHPPSAELQTEIDVLRPLAAELGEIRGWLSVQRRKPLPPVVMPACEQEEVDAYDAAVKERRSIEAQLVGLPEPAYSVEELDAMEKAWKTYVEYHEFKQTNGDRPQETENDLDRFECTLESAKRWDERQRLETVLAKHRKAGSIKCPDCGSDFALEHEHIQKLEEQLEAYADAIDVGKPAYNQDEIDRLRKRAIAWAGRSTKVPTKPTLTPRDIELQRKALATAHLRQQLKPLPEDPTPRRRNWCNYQYQRQQYEKDLVWYSAFEQERDTKLLRLEELKDVESTLENLNRQLKSSLEYEGQITAYHAAMQRYEDDKKRKDEAVARLSDYEAASKGLKNLRSLIKQHLVPSLNRHASVLLSQMTGGQRNAVEIDEDFETMIVDGQPIETLSGSAKAVANLAIRIGLGQVLTNKVFSVFLGDELDASMDPKRADFTAECLAGLTQTIKQVILVSHKEVKVADHEVRLAA